MSNLTKFRRSEDNARAVFDCLEQHPDIDIKRKAASLGASYDTVSSVIERLTALGILRETANAIRNRVFAHESYLSIPRRDT